jgi:hypothetical protein
MARRGLTESPVCIFILCGTVTKISGLEKPVEGIMNFSYRHDSKFVQNSYLILNR